MLVAEEHAFDPITMLNEQLVELVPLAGEHIQRCSDATVDWKKRFVEEEEDATIVGALELLAQPIELRAADAVFIGFSVESDESHARIVERVVGRAPKLRPEFAGDFVEEVVIARHVKDRRLQLFERFAVAVPEFANVRLVFFGIAVDEVTAREDERGSGAI